MAFVRPRKTFKLVFEGEFDGLEVYATSTGTDDYLMISELANVKMPLVGADITKFKKLLKAFADVLVSWNLENEPGAPVPATYDGLLRQDPQFIAVVIEAWMGAVIGALVPATPPEPLDESSLPMEELSPAS